MFATKIGLAIVLLALSGSAGDFPANAHHNVQLARGSAPLCRAEEVTLVRCNVGRTVIAVCGGHLQSGGGYAQYRSATDGRAHIAYPPANADRSNNLTYARMSYMGGGEGQVRFVAGGQEHIIYSRVVRRASGADGLHFPGYEAGVVVRRNRTVLSHRQCDNAFEAFRGPNRFED